MAEEKNDGKNRHTIKWHCINLTSLILLMVISPLIISYGISETKKSVLGFGAILWLFGAFLYNSLNTANED